MKKWKRGIWTSTMVPEEAWPNYPNMDQLDPQVYVTLEDAEAEGQRLLNVDKSETIATFMLKDGYRPIASTLDAFNKFAVQYPCGCRAEVYVGIVAPMGCIMAVCAYHLQQFAPLTVAQMLDALDKTIAPKHYKEQIMEKLGGKS